MGIIDTNENPIAAKRAKIAAQVNTAPQRIAMLIVAPIVRAIFNDRDVPAQDMLAGWNQAATVLNVYNGLGQFLAQFGQQLPPLPFPITVNGDGTVTLVMPPVEPVEPVVEEG